MQQANGGLCSNHFYPRPPRGGRPEQRQKQPRNRQHFYPRPPRGGRPGLIAASTMLPQISIHALREEGDPCLWSPTPWQADFYPRPPRGGRLSLELETDDLMKISIHALREEGDILARLDWVCPKCISIHALREEGDIQRTPEGMEIRQFLSTPSARRATDRLRAKVQRVPHFYPRPPRGGRLFLCAVQGIQINFYPRPPRGGRQQKQRENTLLLSHYTPPCTNCKEMSVNQTAKLHRYLRKRLVFRCEASRKTMCAADSHWPDIKRSARCLGQILGAVQRARPWSGSCCPAGRTADCPRQGRSGRSALL